MRTWNIWYCLGSLHIYQCISIYRNELKLEFLIHHIGALANEIEMVTEKWKTWDRRKKNVIHTNKLWCVCSFGTHCCEPYRNVFLCNDGRFESNTLWERQCNTCNEHVVVVSVVVTGAVAVVVVVAIAVIVNAFKLRHTLSQHVIFPRQT